MSGSDRDPPQTASRPDLRLVPLALVAWAVAWVVTWENRLAIRVTGVICLLMLIGLLLEPAGRRRHVRRHGVMRTGGSPWWLAAGACVALGVFTISWTQVESLRHGPLAEAADSGALVRLTASVRNDPTVSAAGATRPTLTSVELTVRDLTYRGRPWRMRAPVQLSATGEAGAQLAGLEVGTSIRVDAIVSLPDPGTSRAADAHLRGPVQVLRPPAGLDRWLNAVRGGLRAAMRASPAEQAGLVPSLVVGDTSRLPPALEDDFRATSLTHLTAVSGTNLTLMLVFVGTLARGVGVRGWWLRGLTVPVVVLFVLVCRGEPSVLRAAAMGLVAVLATGLGGGSRRGLRHLAAAALLLLLVDPWLARSWGFALSVTATAGILWWGGPWQAVLRRWAPGWLAEAICIPLAAQLATQPLITALAGTVSLVGVTANALAAPFVGPVTILGLVAAVASLLNPLLATGVGWLAGWCVQPIILTAHLGAGLPGATWSWPATPAGIAVLTLACVVAGSLAVPVFRRWWAVLLVLVLLLGASGMPPRTPGWPGEWLTISCDVGQGDATLIRAGPRAAVVVDVGPDPAAMRRCLNQAGVDQVPLLVVTHFHADHIAGLSGLLDTAVVGEALTSPLQSPDVSVRQVLGRLDAAGVRHRPAVPGECLRVGEATWTTVQAGVVPGMAVAGEAENSEENNAGVVGVAESAGLRVMVTGDIEVNAQLAAVAGGQDLHVDVLKAPHHGSARQVRAFWEATGAQVVVFSVGLDNDCGHPTRSAVRLAQDLGMRALRTDQQASVAVTTTRHGRQLLTQRQGHGS